MKAIHYYEAHVTIDPVTNPIEYNKLLAIASEFKFKIADLVMLRGDRPRKDAFMTYHGKDLDETVVAIMNLCGRLRINKFKLRRYKIEDIVLDSRIDDELRLLS